MATYTCICTYIYTWTYIKICAYKCTYTYVHIHMYTHIDIDIEMHKVQVQACISRSANQETPPAHPDDRCRVLGAARNRAAGQQAIEDSKYCQEAQHKPCWGAAQPQTHAPAWRH